MGAIKMVAKFAGKCAKCGKAICVGAMILWAPKTPAAHVECSAAPVASVQHAAPRPRPTTCRCGQALSSWERAHSVRRCIDCRDGGHNPE